MAISHLLAGVLSTGLGVLGVWGHVLVRVGLSEQLVEEVFGPHYAVDGLRGSVPGGRVYHGEQRAAASVPDGSIQYLMVQYST